MQIRIQNLCLLTALIAGTSSAQTFTTLYSFTNANDGANPYGLVLSGKYFVWGGSLWEWL